MNPAFGTALLVVGVGALCSAVALLLRRLGEPRASVHAALTLLLLAGAVPTLAPVVGVRGALGLLTALAGLGLVVGRRLPPLPAASAPPLSALGRGAGGEVSPASAPPLSALGRGAGGEVSSASAPPLSALGRGAGGEVSSASSPPLSALGRGAGGEVSSASSPPLSALGSGAGREVSPVSLPSAAFVLLLVHVALTTYLWDEASTHLPLAGAVARDLWPLEHPLFPGQPLRYHAGFAVLAGLVRATTGLPLDGCVDVVAVVGFVVVVAVVHDAICALGARRHTQLLAVVALLLGGPAAAGLADGWGAALPFTSVLPEAWKNGATFPPLVVTNLFQHPQGLGLPLGLAPLLLAGPGQHSRSRLVVAALGIVLLARVQIVVALLCGVALVVRALWRRDVGGLVALVGAAVVVGVDSGFASGGAALKAGGYFASDGVVGAIVHNGLAFGVSLLALPAALLLARRAREPDLVWALAVIGTVGFVVGNAVHYERSWDIVKFFGVSAFFAHVVVVVAAAHVAARGGAAVVAVALTGAISVSGGAFWLLRHGPLNGVVAAAYREDGTGDDVALFVDAVADVVPAHARVFAPDFLELGRGGLLVPGTSWRKSKDTAALLLDRPATEALTRAYEGARRRLNADDLRALGVSFVVAKVSNRRLVNELHASAFVEVLPLPDAAAARFVVARVKGAP